MMQVRLTNKHMEEEIKLALQEEIGSENKKRMGNPDTFRGAVNKTVT